MVDARDDLMIQIVNTRRRDRQIKDGTYKNIIFGKIGIWVRFPAWKLAFLSEKNTHPQS
jgi:hypothetical protein